MNKKEQIKAEIENLNKNSKNEYILLDKTIFLELVVCTGLFVILGVLNALRIV